MRIGTIGDVVPKLKHVLDFTDEKEVTLSFSELFEQGNYVTVAMEGKADDWQTYAALGLVGKAQLAIDGLSQFEHEDARFYSAVASWIDGDDDKAIHGLQGITIPQAQKLLRIISKPKIQILSQLSSTRMPPSDFLSSPEVHKKFQIQNISFYPHDLRNEPYADIRNYFDPAHPPDFFLSHMSLEHLVPNLQLLPCPIIGHMGDHDLTIQRMYPWYPLMDHFLVNDITEWQDLRQIIPGTISVFPKTHGIGPLPVLAEEPRDIDFFASGSWMHPLHPDKTRMFKRILEMRDLKILLINGFVPVDDYHRLLNHSKLSFNFNRYSSATGIPTRGLDALAMGCALLIQKGNMLSFYVSENEGLITYDGSEEDLVKSVYKALDMGKELEALAHQRSEVIRREFDMSRVASQFLRFATFLAAKQMNPRRLVDTNSLFQKRLSRFSEDAPNEKFRQVNLTRWMSKLSIDSSPHIYADMARELLLEVFSPYVVQESPPKLPLLLKAREIYKEGIAKFPDSLVLRFNYLRLLFHSSQEMFASEAVELARNTVEKQPQFWKLDFMEDIFTWDFAMTFFNYRKYYELVMDDVLHKERVQLQLVNLIRASICYYLGRHLQDVELLGKARSFDPEFSIYAFYYARALIEIGRGNEAGPILLELADSFLFAEAFELLQHLELTQQFIVPGYVELKDKMQRCLSHLSQIHSYDINAGNFEATFLKSSSEKKSVNIGIRKRNSKAPLISIIVPVLNRLVMTRHFVSRLQQVTDGYPIEIILLDDEATRDHVASLEPLQWGSDGDVRVVRSANHSTVVQSWNHGARVATGKYLVFFEHEHLPEQYWLQALMKEVEVSSTVAIVGSKIVTLGKRIFHAGVIFSRIFHSPFLIYKNLPPEFPPANRRRELQAVAASGMLVRREAFEVAGGFNESFTSGLADIDFCLRVGSRGGQVIYQPESCLVQSIDFGRHATYPEDELSRFTSLWSQQFLIDEDACYVSDGYAVWSRPSQGSLELKLWPLMTDEDKLKWESIAAVQQIAQRGGVEAAKSILEQPDQWPEDYGALSWGAKMCEQIGFLEEAAALWKRALLVCNAEEAQQALSRCANGGSL